MYWYDIFSIGHNLRHSISNLIATEMIQNLFVKSRPYPPTQAGINIYYYYSTACTFIL